MSSKWIRRLGLVAIAGAVMHGAIGCAQERDPINRVQSSALSKHFFVGDDLSSPKDDPEFYMRNTVVDVPYGAAQDGIFTATYAQPLSRIKWEITGSDEHATRLVARQTYEHIQSSDFKGSRRTNDGQVVAMFQVLSHFDIRRAYNTTTGEELNVIEENTTDRPWYQREFFRVDWGKNMVTDGYEVDTLSQMGVFGGIQWDPMAYAVDNPDDPNHPVFSQNEGYFDVTTKAFATPKVVEIPELPGEKFPFCFFPSEYGGGAPIANCNPTEVTLRLSFKRVVDNDYEAVDWNGQRQEAFGWFTVDRYGYERNYGVLDEKWHRFAAKYNIWQQSHVSTKSEDPSKRQYAQCATDYWRDADGNVAKYKVDKDGNFLQDTATGLPIPAGANEKFALPHPQSPIGKDVHRDENKNGTEDECEIANANGDLYYPGARCDEFANKCALPHHMRELRTIPWYYGPDSAADLFASTNNALDQWNVAIKRAAEIGKMVSARRVGADIPANVITDEDGLIADAGAKVPHVFVLCHNPTTDTDHPACRGVAMSAQPTCIAKTDANKGNDACNWGGPKGDHGIRTQVFARLGDIRYNIVNIIPTPQTPSPWGIMVDANDPLTGEKVVTSVNEWGHVLDIASQGTEDLLRWINGEISDAQIMNGQYLRDWIGATALGKKSFAPQILETKDLQSRLRSLDTSASKSNGLTKQDAALPKELQYKKAAAALASTLGPSLDTKFEAFRQSVIGTEWEARMVTPEWLQGAGYPKDTKVAGNDALLSVASPMRGMNPTVHAQLARLRQTGMAARGTCMVEQPEPDALVGMARQAGRLYPLPDKNDPDYPALKATRDAKLHQWIREQFHVAVIAHEMGHSVGLRHNFTGSYDALNYHPQYWQLRTRNGKEHFCTQDANFTPDSKLDATTPHAKGEECIGPRWVDPLTDAETNGLIWKWGSTTVMDYPGDQTQDMNNLGQYDKAAMRFGYADVVDLDNDAILTGGVGDGSQTTKGSAYLFALDGFGGIVGQSIGGNHYSTFNDKYGILRNCTAPTDPNDLLTAKCDTFDMDYASVRDMKSTGKYGDAALDHLPETAANFSVHVPTDAEKAAGAPKFRVRHPYMFGSDEYADTGNVPVFRFDAGGDSYEQFQFLITTYENRYIFDNFRRDRVTFSSRGVIGRQQDRYFSKIQGMTKSLALLIALQSQVDQALNDPGQLMPLALGASDGLAMFARIMTRPEPGPYTVNLPDDPTKTLPFAQALNNNFITLPAAAFNIAAGSGEGRYLHNEYDYTKGYYWSEYQKWAGSYYEKHLAVHFLTEAYNHFLSNSKQDYIDGRYKNLNYASIYPNQVRRLFSQVLQGDPMTYGPYVVTTGTGGLDKNKVARVRYLPWETYDARNPSTQVLDYSADAYVLDPLVGWEQQYRMLMNVFWFGPSTLTMDMVDQARIYTPGGADAVTIDPSEQLRFKDPATGIIYYSRSYGKEMVNAKVGMVQRSMGARMLEYANQLAATAYVIQSVDPVTGEPTYKKDGSGQPICVDPLLCQASAQKLTSFVANLDVVRQLTRKYGYGPLGHGE